MKEKIVALLGLAMVVAMATLLIPIRDRNREYEENISRLEAELVKKEESISAAQQVQDELVANLEKQNQRLQATNQKLSEELASTFLTTMLIATKDGSFNSEVFLNNSEEEAKENAILLCEENQYFFFINHGEEIQIQEISVNGKDVEVDRKDGHLTFNPNLKMGDSILIKITYKYKDVIVSKYVTIINKK